VTAVHVRMRAADEQYALPVEAALEVAELGDVTPVPGARASIIGVRNLRGQVIPVVDLARMLDVPRDGAPQRVVIAEDGGRKAGLAVDEVIGVEALPPPSEDVDSPHVSRAALVDGALVGLLDLPSILDAVQGSAP
jgi:purine-binding chemotaxis protein CheW